MLCPTADSLVNERHQPRVSGTSLVIRARDNAPCKACKRFVSESSKTIATPMLEQVCQMPLNRERITNETKNSNNLPYDGAPSLDAKITNETENI